MPQSSNSGILVAYHGTSAASKKRILQEGFRFDQSLRGGRTLGDAVYCSTSRQASLRFGGSVIRLGLLESRVPLVDYNEIFKDGMAHVQHYFAANPAEHQRVLSLSSDASEAVIGNLIKQRLLSKGLSAFRYAVQKDRYNIVIYDPQVIASML